MRKLPLDTMLPSSVPPNLTNIVGTIADVFKKQLDKLLQEVPGQLACGGCVALLAPLSNILLDQIITRQT